MPPLHEETIVKVRLGHVVGAAISLAGMFGGWMVYMQVQLWEVRTDVAVIRQALEGSSTTAAAFAENK